ncbi:MAG TPA: bifunctional riboflavin kinase/FAD synthetase [Firmicutes bacterium]|nr:bifunctional riboflavin kinase/FAD synthetase [Bacillota bacterium]
MIWVQGLEKWPEPGRPLYLALGNFDGVHRGHQLILNRTVDMARQNGGVSAVLVFNPHPQALFKPDLPFSMLTDLHSKAELIAALGVDYLIIQKFNLQLASTPPEVFVNKYLWEKLKVSGVIIGEDYSFGREGQGTPFTMRRLAKKYGFSVEVCPLLKYNGRLASSSAIRELINSGAVSEASGLLNYYFFRYGQVVRGAGRGNQLLYPTANLKVSSGLLWPGKGVYLTAVEGAAEQVCFGVTNVGGTPTFQQETMSVETHILSFNGRLYGKTLKIYFLERLREIISFNDPQDLKKQIARDISLASKILDTEYQLFRTGFLETAGSINR